MTAVVNMRTVFGRDLRVEMLFEKTEAATNA
jgi:hypothetical protein